MVFGASAQNADALPEQAVAETVDQVKPSVPATPKPLSQQAQLIEKADKAKDSFKASKKSMMIEALEPVRQENGVRIRGKQTVLASAVDARDIFGINSLHLLAVVVATLVLIGPVRFLGTPAAVVFFIALLIYAAIDLLKITEARSRREGCFYFSRATIYVVGGLVLIILLASFRVYQSKSNAELEGRGTFLPVPPQYDLAKIRGQDVYVSTIFGIMHINLFVLILLPLPVAYGLQASFVKWFPWLRFWVPQSPVWLHRILGYTIIIGLSFTGALWTIFQGAECFRNQTIQACEAFDPETLAGIDVYVLRFHIVWPLGFFFIPLMIYARYPGTLESTSQKEALSSTAAPGMLEAGSEQGNAKEN